MVYTIIKQACLTLSCLSLLLLSSSCCWTGCKKECDARQESKKMARKHNDVRKNVDVMENETEMEEQEKECKNGVCTMKKKRAKKEEKSCKSCKTCETCPKKKSDKK